MPRPPSPGAHDALLEAAREEFARRGLDRARVEDIARRAKVSKGAFYLHFRTKDDAFREIVQRFLGALEDHALRHKDVADRAIEEAGDDEDVDARRFAAECDADVDLLDLLWRNRLIVSAVDGSSGKRARDLVADFRARMRALVASRMVDRQGTWRLRHDVEPEVIADIIVGTYEDFARRMVDMKEKPDLGAWARSFLVVLYEGIVERPEPGPRRPGHAAPNVG